MMDIHDPEIATLVTEALASAGIGTWLISLDRKELVWSEVTRRLHEVEPDFEPDYDSAMAFYAPKAGSMIQAAVEAGMADGQPWEHEVPLITARGRRKWVHVSGRATLRDGKPAYLAGTIADITARHEALETNARLSFILAQAQCAVVITDRLGRVEWTNSGFERILGITGNAIQRRILWPLLRRGQQACGEGGGPSLYALLAAGGPFTIEIELRDRAGTDIRLTVDITPIAEQDGATTSFIVMANDITSRKRAEAAASEELARRLAAETLLRELQDALPAAVVAYDADERMIFFNSAYINFFPRMAPAMRIGARLEDVLRFGLARNQFVESGTTPAQQEAWLAEYLAAHRNPGHSRELELPDGRWLQLRERRSPSGYLVCTRTDITRLKRAEALAQRQAEEDSLTGVGNRALMMRKLEGWVASRRDSDAHTGCLLLIDVDHFKAINDSLGHPAGDALLQALASRARGLARKEDTVARLGGDEFAILMPNLSQASQVVSFIGRLRSRLEIPLTYGTSTITPSLSIGAAIFPVDGEDAGTLMRSADTALYQAKRQGRHCHSFFDRSIAEALKRRAYLAEALRGAIVRREITIDLQPQIDIASGRHIGFEALARWSDEGLPVPPSEFIPVAEEMGLIVDLGRVVLRLALKAIAELRQQGVEPGRVAVNVAAAQLLTDGFAEGVAHALARYGISPDFLEIELTETTLLDRSAERIIQVLQALRTMGVSIALDDFGTGYASLSHLTQFPVHRLKIDRRFVQGIERGTAPSPIVRTVIGLAHGLGMEVVAEGVENEAQLSYLSSLGCNLAQGYLISRPMTPEAALTYLSDAQARMWVRPECKALLQD